MKLDFSRIRKNRLARQRAEKRLEKMTLGELYDFVERKERERTMKAFVGEDPIVEARARYLKRAKAILAENFSAQPPKATARKSKTTAKERKMPFHFTVKSRK